MRVFFAGTNGSEKEEKDCDIKYRLTTFIEGEKSCAKALSLAGKENFLLDSGAFSYMSGKKCTKESLLIYLQEYIDFINKYDVKYFFELDVDTIFGIDFVEEMRKKLEKETGKQCIPVWHKGRGIDYWKKMVDEYRYIAIGGLVFHVKKQEWPLIKKMVDYAYSRNVKVHGLGFTKTKILEEENWHFYSVDSISWKISATLGQQVDKFTGNYIKRVKKLTKKGIKINLAKLTNHNLIEWCKYQKYMDLKKW